MLFEDIYNADIEQLEVLLKQLREEVHKEVEIDDVEDIYGINKRIRRFQEEVNFQIDRTETLISKIGPSRYEKEKLNFLGMSLARIMSAMADEDEDLDDDLTASASNAHSQGKTNLANAINKVKKVIQNTISPIISKISKTIGQIILNLLTPKTGVLMENWGQEF